MSSLPDAQRQLHLAALGVTLGSQLSAQRSFGTFTRTHNNSTTTNVGSGLHSRVSVLGSSGGGDFLGSVCQRRFQFARPTNPEIAAACRALECRVDTDPKALKKQYLDLVKKFHPDKAGGSEDKMKTISTAYNLIKGLSTAEKKAYEAHQSGRTYTTTSSKQRPQASYGGGGNAYNYQSSGAAWGGGKSGQQSSRAAYDWQRMYEAQQQAQTQDFRYNHYASGHTNRKREQNMSPRGTSERDARSLIRKIATTPFMTFFKRFMMWYCGLVLLFSILYRRRRDREEQEGWEFNESLNRRERLENLYKMREEVLDKVGSNQYASRLQAEREKEKRVLEWASLKQREMAELQRCGFASFHPSLGYLHRKPEEPEGVVYFEPRKEMAPQDLGGLGVITRETRVGPDGQPIKEKVLDLRQGGALHPFLQRQPGQPTTPGAGPGGLSPGEAALGADAAKTDVSQMSPRNRALLARRERERQEQGGAAQEIPINVPSPAERTQPGQLPENYTQPQNQQGIFFLNTPSDQPPQQQQQPQGGFKPITHQASQLHRFPMSAQEQVEAIQARTRLNPDGSVAHEMPPGLAAARASPTGGAYPDLPPALYGIRPGSIQVRQDKSPDGPVASSVG